MVAKGPPTEHVFAARTGAPLITFSSRGHSHNKCAVPQSSPASAAHSSSAASAEAVRRFLASCNTDNGCNDAADCGDDDEDGNEGEEKSRTDEDKE